MTTPLGCEVRISQGMSQRIMPKSSKVTQLVRTKDKIFTTSVLTHQVKKWYNQPRVTLLALGYATFPHN